ncbi:MAG: hypothetical protein PUP92_21410 [Rhizonema sp. PD38]|nr:hypothetical protein [Rhizonema sp. PD38]
MSYKTSNVESHLQVWRGIDVDKIEELEEQVEFLLEQIESLKLYLCQKNYELQEIKEELSKTTQELYAALNAQPITIDETIELTKKLLASNLFTEKTLVELLIAINSAWCMSSKKNFPALFMQCQK